MMTGYSIGSIAKIRVSSLSFERANRWVGTFEQAVPPAAWNFLF
jgi:hypothetical protein